MNKLSELIKQKENIHSRMMLNKSLFFNKIRPYFLKYIQEVKENNKIQYKYFTEYFETNLVTFPEINLKFKMEDFIPDKDYILAEEELYSYLMSNNQRDEDGDSNYTWMWNQSFYNANYLWNYYNLSLVKKRIENQIENLINYEREK